MIIVDQIKVDYSISKKIKNSAVTKEGASGEQEQEQEHHVPPRVDWEMAQPTYDQSVRLINRVFDRLNMQRENHAIPLAYY